MPETRDWDARDYAAHLAAQQEWARELVAEHLADRPRHLSRRRGRRLHRRVPA
jgi:hypothetical protein